MMRTLSLVGLFLVGCAANPEPMVVPGTPGAYPVAHKGDTTDNYHGEQVADPYRWLEDLDSAETRAWVTAQNQLTEQHLGAIPQRASIRNALETAWNFERRTAPRRAGGRYFFTRNTGLQDQSVLYWSPELGGGERALLDPNTLQKGGIAALKDYVPSPDGQYLAYGVAMAGSDWTEWRIRDVEGAADLSDNLKWIKFSRVSWLRDSSGFFYSRYNEPKAGDALEEANYNNKLYLHRVGTSQADDVLVYERPQDKEWGFDGEVTDDGRYLVITVFKGTDDRYRVLLGDLSKSPIKVKELVGNFDAEYRFLGSAGSSLLFKTTKNAPRSRIVAIDPKKPEENAWKEIVPQQASALENVTRMGNTLVLQYLKDATAELKVVALDGKALRDVALPGPGSIDDIWGDSESSEGFFVYQSFVQPKTVYRYDATQGNMSIWFEPKLARSVEGLKTTQVFYTSKDGTRIPMFITTKGDIKYDSSTPTLLYGYGGFNISITPYYSVANAVWMEMGGAFAVATLRGGGEYGQAWHEAGQLKNKQNVFDDFIAGAEWLIANKVTSKDKLAIQGRSNGGLLVGAVMTQRPDLFAAALPGVGVLDMLRFDKFTIGWAWRDDYGSSEDPAMYPVLKAYSPLHNVKSGTAYPATLITTGDHDDRVVPSHSYKFAATLQAAHAGTAPVLIRIDTDAGHGSGKPTSKQIEEVADTWAFLVKTLNMVGSQP